MERSLDPDDWQTLRALGHRMLDDMIDDIAGIRDEPVWREMPAVAAPRNADGAAARRAGPRGGLRRFSAGSSCLYATGNRHPRFMGWVHGGGTAVGMLAEMLAAGLNANLGGRDHAPIEIERQVIAMVGGDAGAAARRRPA